MRVADIHWFAWEPVAQRITLGAHLDVDERRYAVAVALAHRALGHIGNSCEQRTEAHALADYWLDSSDMERLPIGLAA